MYGASGLSYYRWANGLGSAVLATTPARTLLSSDHYTPFGFDLTGAGAEYRSFTGNPRWSDTTHTGGQYDFMAREYNSEQGRWWTPDPSGLAAVDRANPQPWNAYSHVNDQPLTVVDPLGTCATVNLNDTNSDGDEASGDFGPYVSQDETAAGSADGGNIQQCLTYGSTNPWDELEIDGGSVDGGMGLGDDLEYGGAGGTGEAVGAVQTDSIGGGLQTTAYQTDINGTPLVQPSDANCQARILADVDNQFGTTASEWRVVTGSVVPSGGEYNLELTSAALAPAQFNAVQLGRYASLATMITGIGSSLHVAGRSALDTDAVFSKTDAGGVPSIIITAHIDSGYAYNPLGLLTHYLTDVLGYATRDECPQ